MFSASSRWPRRLARFWPAAAQVGHLERWRAGLLAVLGIAVTGGLTHLLVGAEAVPWLVASMGASSVIVFGLPHSPLGQPWPLVGGQVISALVGVACARYLPASWPVAGLAVGAAIVAMHYTRSLHPPGGAAALTAVIGGESVRQLGFGFALLPVGLNALLLLAVALIANNAVRGRRYPTPRESERKPTARVNEADWEAALGRAGEVVDITPEALAELAAEAERHALARQPGAPRCIDLARSMPATVAPDDTLRAVWPALEAHGEVAVLDADGRLLGTLGWQQLFDAGPASGQLAAVADLLLRRAGEHVVVWMRPAATVGADLPWTALVPMLQSQAAAYVVDADHRLLGVVRPAQLLALYPPPIKGAMR
ncbi:HPP family protein [Chitinolyticbacter meiyuanensis]|uniref:HPP family protein n=1 Tax=Chitinolyticbacter meiyuanensis TaxID=682798 RepID=UPI0011E59546|nr:HPP family protein [Chitinolyticbacter meiyuanensis]